MMKTYRSMSELMNDMDQLRDCTILITKYLERTLTRLNKEELTEFKSLIKIKNINIKVNNERVK